MRAIDANKLSREIIKAPVADFFTYQNGQMVWSQTILRFIGEQPTVKAIRMEQVARMLNKVTNGFPCIEISMPGIENINKWCEENCGKTEHEDCWLHALKEGWLDE